MYLGWYDPDKKKSASAKVQDAADRYARKWGTPARVAIVNAEQAADIETTLEVRPATHVPPNTFFVGEDEVE